jgi:hypothetical protein
MDPMEFPHTNSGNISRQSKDILTRLQNAGKYGELSGHMVALSTVASDDIIMKVSEIAKMLKSDYKSDSRYTEIQMNLKDYYSNITEISRIISKENKSEEHEDMLQKINKIQSIIHMVLPELNSSHILQSMEVPRPIRSNQINSNQATDWVDQHPPECRKAARALIDNITHITQNNFESTFTETVKQFNIFIEEKEKNNAFEYVVGLEDQKSNAWMFELAKPILIRPPKIEIPLAYTAELHKEVSKYLEKQESFFPKNIVFFDDGIFSGEQMEKIIRLIFNAIDYENTRIENANKTSQADPLQPIPRPHMIVVCPYMTKFAKKYLEDKFKTEVTLFTTQEIKTVKDIVPCQELEILQKMNPWVDLGDQKETSGPESDIDKYRKDIANRGTIYFDHKVPDRFSFPDVLAKGVIRDINGNKKGQLEELIPETVPPYKSKLTTKITSTSSTTTPIISIRPMQKLQPSPKNRLDYLKKTPKKDDKNI